MKKTILPLAIVVSLLTACNDDVSNTQKSLGEKFFNDASLSKDGTQSCATCHDPKHGFIDARLKAPANVKLTDGSKIGAVSVGQDNVAIGDRNTPMASYAAFIPDFHFDSEEKLFKGGQFLDGREKNLQGQAGQPFLNLVEMQSTKEEVVRKVKAKYGLSLKTVFGSDVFSSTDKAYNAITQSIAEFERTEDFSPFDSKFDRYLKGKSSLSADELKGLEIFKDENKANCAACHPIPKSSTKKTDSLFTDHTYDNLGVPINTVVRAINRKGIDDGLFLNPAVNDETLKGAFRVSSLRNIAVTPPYMHNGVFQDLKTVVHFYNTRDVVKAINPETGAAWKSPEIATTMNTEELGDLGLSDKEEKLIVLFLKTLTDRKFEHLMSD